MTTDERNAPTIPAPPPVCRCSCGSDYAEDEWLKLPLATTASFPDGVAPDGEGGWLEYRNCTTCDSTRVILLLSAPVASEVRAA